MKSLNTYALDVLGCKVNQYDARQIARLLEGFGLRPAARGELADLVAVHTCGVTAAAVKKCRQSVRQLMKKHPGAVVFLTGCAAGEELMDEPDFSGIRVSAGPGWVQRLADELQAFALPNPDFRLPLNSDELPAEKPESRTRAFLKIQDGCDANCAYCIVPQLRKKPRDKSMNAAVAEAEALVQGGCKEIVIAGVHVGLYGRGTDTSLSDVLSRLLKISGIGRIRMSSLHPSELTNELLAVWSSSPNVMPHLHLSLQSGSDGVLKRMGRGYTSAEFSDAVRRARNILNNPAITTDVIVGFPGETDAEFEQTFDFCKEIGFAGMHIFTFSPRPGTRAAEMPDPVPAAVAHERQKRLSGLAKEMSETFNRMFIGKTVNVLVERQTRHTCAGVTEHYIPTRFQCLEKVRGTVVPVQVVSASPDRLDGI